MPILRQIPGCAVLGKPTSIVVCGSQQAHLLVIAMMKVVVVGGPVFCALVDVLGVKFENCFCFDDVDDVAAFVVREVVVELVVVVWEQFDSAGHHVFQRLVLFLLKVLEPGHRLLHILF